MKLWPLDDTVFDEAIAERLAADCYRTHSPGPWAQHGKVRELLEGLWWAEVGYRKSSQLDVGTRAYRNLMTKFKRKGGFGTKIQAAVIEWQKMSDEERRYFAYAMMSTGENGDASEIEKRVGTFMEACLYANELLQPTEEISRGPIPQLAGLKAFVDRLKVVWKRNDLGEEFTAEFDTREEADCSRHPVSSAAKLVCFSAALIDPRYTAKTCETVMRPR